MFLQFSQNKFAFVGAAGFVQGVVGLVGGFGCAAEKFGRQVVGLDFGLRAHDYQALDQIAEFADVAGPGVTQEDVHGGVAEFAYFFAVGYAEFVEEMVGKRGDVAQAFAERWDEEGNYVQSIKQILAKRSSRNFIF